jgi:fatty acid desaturase
MRRRERAYALVLGTICAFSLLAGAWPLPLIAFALIELSYSAVEHAAATRSRRGERARRSRPAPVWNPLEVSSAVHHEHLASG